MLKLGDKNVTFKLVQIHIHPIMLQILYNYILLKTLKSNNVYPVTEPTVITVTTVTTVT